MPPHVQFNNGYFVKGKRNTDEKKKYIKYKIKLNILLPF